MKGLLVLLGALALVQARSSGLDGREAAALGENPWFVHLRVANFNQGLLQSCAGALIHNRWVLTCNKCISDARFIWIRYGVVDVWRPALVTEASQIRTHSDGLSLININRNVEYTDNIGAIPLASANNEVPSSGKFCGFGGDDDVPGETLKCFNIDLSGSSSEESEESKETKTFFSRGGEGELTQFDYGAPVVADGILHGVLVDDSTFLSPVEYRDWIEEQTGIQLTPPEESEESGDGEIEGEGGDKGDENLLVHFIN